MSDSLNIGEEEVQSLIADLSATIDVIPKWITTEILEEDPKLKSLKKYGITKHHRKKFKPVYNILMRSTRETL